MTNNRAKALEALEQWDAFRGHEFAGRILFEHLETIREALTVPQWQTMDSVPLNGTEFYARFETPMRWLPYKGNSQQFKSGIKGRWQMMSEYGGWENTDYVPIEWRPHEDDVPPPPTGEKS